MPSTVRARTERHAAQPLEEMRPEGEQTVAAIRSRRNQREYVAPLVPASASGMRRRDLSAKPPSRVGRLRHRRSQSRPSRHSQEQVALQP